MESNKVVLTKKFTCLSTFTRHLSDKIQHVGKAFCFLVPENTSVMQRGSNTIQEAIQ